MKLSETAKKNRKLKRSRARVKPYPTEHYAIRQSADPDPTPAQLMMDRDDDYQYRNGAFINDVSDRYGRACDEF
jgi:hypothetical protein